MNDATLKVPEPYNEPVLSYAPDSDERVRLTAALDAIAGEQPEIPCIIGGERVETGKLESVVMPHKKDHVLARFHAAGPAEVERAIRACADAKREWEAMSFDSRASIILRAAELLATKHRMRINAATMLGQSKTCYQAEIDSACELIDFLRFNVSYAQGIYGQQPLSPHGMWNRMEYRPLEGFVLAITPFNFTAIAGNLPTAPALMGNTALWKPSESQTLAAYHFYLLLEEAGMPPGVVNFLPGDGDVVSRAAMAHPDFGGLHFTGSTFVFRELWKRAGENLDKYKSYPRIVGETGGKDFIVAHASADPDALITAIVRGGYEFQGQKCSAVSRIYVAESVWKKIESRLVETIQGLPMGDVTDYRNFLGAVIKQSAFDKHARYLEQAKKDQGVKVLAGGETDDSVGWFVRPTLLRCDDPQYATMREELFGPIVSAHVYPDNRYKEVLEIVDQTSAYALTGAVFADERAAVEEADRALRHAAGNFYVNDKPTGSVVGQQPFGGARCSGTNDKAGSAMNLLRWVSPRSIKETFVPPIDHRYPHMD